MDTYVRGQALFEATLMNIGDNDRDGMFCSRKNGAKKGEHQFVKRLNLMSPKQRRQIFKQVSPTPLR
jgi:hypothetical protein